MALASFVRNPIVQRFAFRASFSLSMRVTRMRSEGLQELDAAAAAFAQTLRPGDVVALRGALGAGKTAFVAATVRALHGDDAATSPTFTFWHRYEGVPPVHHLDFYRIETPEELPAMGLEEAFTGDAVVFVEWPDRAPELLPATAIDVTITGSGDEPRDIEIARP
jgi:tRNA threonylcarbamoyladenosine biosynthesis protein TsaE